MHFLEERWACSERNQQRLAVAWHLPQYNNDAAVALGGGAKRCPPAFVHHLAGFLEAPKTVHQAPCSPRPAERRRSCPSLLCMLVCKFLGGFDARASAGGSSPERALFPRSLQSSALDPSSPPGRSAAATSVMIPPPNHSGYSMLNSPTTVESGALSTLCLRLQTPPQKNATPSAFSSSSTHPSQLRNQRCWLPFVHTDRDRERRRDLKVVTLEDGQDDRHPQVDHSLLHWEEEKRKTRQISLCISTSHLPRRLVLILRLIQLPLCISVSSWADMIPTRGLNRVAAMRTTDPLE